MLQCDSSTPVVVLPGARQGGLGIVRSLGRLGIPVYMIDPDPAAPALHTRYCRGKFVHNFEKDSAAAAIAFLGSVRKQLGRKAILIPTSDTLAMFVDEHAATLREWFLFPERPEGLARSLSSKKEMYLLACRHGVPTAATAFPQSRREVIEYLERARFPLVLKAIYGARIKFRAGQPVQIVRSASELLKRYDALEDPSEPNLMLQEYIPGGEDSIWMFNGYFDSASECVVGFTGKKLRQCPAYTGQTSLGICLRNEQVARTTCDLMRAVGYRGIIDLGYRYDARDGQYKILDVNPRIGATFRLFVGDNGMDVARALYLDLTGQPIEAAPAREGRKWIVEDSDLVSSIRYHRDGRLTLGGWLRSLRGIQECALWASDDPLPLAWVLQADARQALSRIKNRLVRRRTRRQFNYAKS